MISVQHRVPELRIGCSGWNYKSWRGQFYPAGLPPSRWLPFYASVFDTVEANGTFYKLPERETFAGWAAATPPGFVMAVKASRYLTHLKRLLEPEEPLQRLFEPRPRTRVAARARFSTSYRRNCGAITRDSSGSFVGCPDAWRAAARRVCGMSSSSAIPRGTCRRRLRCSPRTT